MTELKSDILIEVISSLLINILLSAELTRFCRLVILILALTPLFLSTNSLSLASKDTCSIISLAISGICIFEIVSEFNFDS